MNYSDLENDKMIKRGKFSKRQIEETMNLAKRDIETAKKIVDDDPDWGFSIAYNAMLQASRALMLHKGYRPIGERQHVTVIEFVKIAFEKKFATSVEFMDRMRRKRHKAIYDVGGLISTKEALEAIENATFFVQNVTDILHS
jgi:uncharacterized protein (UPF0332 family)